MQLRRLVCTIAACALPKTTKALRSKAKITPVTLSFIFVTYIPDSIQSTCNYMTSAPDHLRAIQLYSLDANNYNCLQCDHSSKTFAHKYSYVPTPCVKREVVWCSLFAHVQLFPENRKYGICSQLPKLVLSTWLEEMSLHGYGDSLYGL